MRGHQAFDAFTSIGVGRHGAACQHGFQDPQKLFGDFVISLVAGMMEGEQDLVR